MSRSIYTPEETRLTILGVEVTRILKAGALIAFTNLLVFSIVYLRSLFSDGHTLMSGQSNMSFRLFISVSLTFSFLFFLAAIPGIPKSAFWGSLISNATGWAKGSLAALAALAILHFIPIFQEDGSPVVMNGNKYLISNCCKKGVNPIVRVQGRHELRSCASIVRELSEEEYTEKVQERERGFFALGMALSAGFLTVLRSRIKDYSEDVYA